MTVQITIIGLGQIGSSLGLALKAHNLDFHIVGHDKDPQAARQAQKLGAVDETKFNLPASVENAKIIILALPFDGIRETLEVIRPDLQEGALILDTAPSKSAVAALVRENIPPGRFYVGLTPAINPVYLHDTEVGVKAARADLFNKGLMVVNAPPGTPENVFNLTMDLVALFGAMPLLMDLAEADGVFAAIHLLPQLAASALLGSTVDQPGWLEARKLAGRPYATVTSGAPERAEALALRDAVLGNRENVVRLLNTYLASLIQLRDEIEDNDRDALTKRLEAAAQGRERWITERFLAEWLQNEAPQVDVPSFGSRVNQTFFGAKFADRMKPKK